MATTLSIDEAQATLADLIHRLAPGEEIVITENQQPVARLVSQPQPLKRREPGRCKGMITLLVEDDEHLESFKSLPMHHKDPFDRMIVSQGIAEQIPVVRADASLDAYEVQRLW